MLVKCPNCGTLVSDKAAKCPKCGMSLAKEPSVNMEYSGLVKVLNKIVEMKDKFPDFWTKVSIFPDNFSIEPIIEVITECDESKDLSVQINFTDLQKMNLVAKFEALEYHDEFESNDSSDDPYTWVTVQDTSMAAKIAYDLLTLVFNKKYSSARFIITGVDEDSDNAKYNSNGEFLEGKGYGQGEFAYYQPSNNNSSEQEITSADQNADGTSGGYGKIIWWIIGIIAFLIYVFN